MKEAVIISFAFLIASTTANAQVITWQQYNDVINIGQKVLLLEDKEGTLNIQKVSSSRDSAMFYLSRNPILHFGFTNSIYWLKFNFENLTPDSVWLQLGHAFIPYAELYFKDSSGSWKSLKSGYKVPLGQKPVIDHNQIFPLPRGRNEFYLRLRPYAHAIPIELWEKNKWQLKAVKQKIIYGMYVGILLFVISANIFLFFALGKIYYLNYALLVFLYISTSALVMEGYAVYLFPRIDLMNWYKIVPVLDMAALLTYCMTFFELKKYSAKLYKISLFAVFFFLLYTVLLNFLPLLPVIIINQVFALVVFVLATSIGITVGEKGNKLGYYFAGAYSIWFILIFIEVIYIQNGRPKHISEISYVSLGIFIESFLLAYLLAKRFQWDKIADERKQFEMLTRIGRMQQQFQHEILTTKLEIQEQTFLNISQEIHDNIGQILSLAMLNMNIISPEVSESDNQKLAVSRELITGAIQDLRDLAKSLNTDFINDLGLSKAIEQQLQILQKTGVYTCHLEVLGDTVQYPSQHELLVFRIIQELLNNIIKHAEATSVSILIDYRHSNLIIVINDNGKGFDIAEINAETSKGLGLKNMMHRIALINGSINIDSKPNLGTTSTVVLHKGAQPVAG